jgi:allantoicase
MSQKTDPSYNDKFSSQWINLAEARNGTKVLDCSDDFFAEKENLVKRERAVFIADKYTDRGKWMDGWESRRKRTPGNDWLTLRLGLPGTIKGVDIDTAFFLGNHPPFASIEACEIEGDPDQGTRWTEILSKSPLQPGSQNLFEVNSGKRWTHLRLWIYPDGGVARLRVYGEVSVDWSKVKKGELVDLAAVQNGGKVLVCNDMFFGPKDNLIAPGRGVNMGDGWETRRKRQLPGQDWCVLALGHRGTLKKIEVDTAHFKGNYPDRCTIEVFDGSTEEVLKNPEKVAWKPLLGEQKLQADKQHFFEKELAQAGPVTHVKLNIIPDGGVSRLRVFGVID